MKWHNRVWTDVSHSFPEVNGDIWKLLLLGDTKFVLLDEPFDYLSFHLADKLIELIKKHSVNKGIVISDHNYGKVLEVVNRLTLIREGVLLELTDKRGLVEQGYLLSESYL